MRNRLRVEIAANDADAGIAATDRRHGGIGEPARDGGVARGGAVDNEDVGHWGLL
jgi:hypothetical protein